jgi:hypothetical protein
MKRPWLLAVIALAVTGFSPGSVDTWEAARPEPGRHGCSADGDVRPGNRERALAHSCGVPLPTHCSAETTPLAVNYNNQLSAAGYDAAGNMINNGGGAYVYDGESQLVSAGGFTYIYDGDGNRVAKTNGSTGTLYWYGEGGILLETDLTGNPWS